jgi:hypothetical protein
MRKYISSAVFVLVWVLLILLPQLNISAIPVSVLSFLTFVHRSFGSSAFAFFSRLAGQGLYAYRVTSMVSPVVKDKKPLKRISKSLKKSFYNYKNNIYDTASFIAGAGTALVFCDFINGYSTPWKNMASVAAIIMTMNTLEKSKWFPVRKINAVMDKIEEITKEIVDIRKMIKGLSAGFALSILTSMVHIENTCYVIGGTLIIAAVTLSAIKATGNNLTSRAKV